MFSKLFRGFTACLILSNLNSHSTGLIPYNGTPGVHAVYRGIWAVFDNPAGIAEQTAFSTGISYQSQFLMQELSTKALAMVIPMKKVGNLGVGYQQFGYELYKDQRGCLVYSKSFGTAVSAGVRFDYIASKFGGEYGSTSAITGSVGVIARITEAVRVGASVFNPQRAKFSDDGEERYPAIMMAGLSWNFGGETELGLGISKSGDSKHLFQCALRYQVSPKFILHGSVSNGADPFLFGYAFKIGKLEIGMASGYHQMLGFSPCFSLTFKNK